MKAALIASPRLDPRKSPVQARSTASVEAILDATIQLLLAIGKERLTTTRVAHRAGVSVGTLYQYFPNKSALLQAALTRHLMHVACVIENTCEQQRGHPLPEMITALITNFFAAKMQNIKTSIALYQVSSDLDGARVVRQTGTRTNKAITAMLATSPDPIPDPALAATILSGAMTGVSRRVLESPAPEKHLPAIRQEMITMATAYLTTIAITTHVQSTRRSARQ
jgi:AcrR family transcriptional regulator